jgi:site-specific DNA-methyltransferase (adenine-specific)
MLEIENKEGLRYLQSIKDNSIDLVLTDPPYIISRETGMNSLYNTVKEADAEACDVKTEDDWVKYKKTLKKPKEELANDCGKGWSKTNYLKYGSILGKKYAVCTEYGTWDSEFTIEVLDKFIEEFYKKLRKGGTMIMFFDIWKITTLKELIDKHKFKQIRFIEWIKTNPQPLNQKVNYLTNCREIALVGVKGGKPTFNSIYDNGIYKFPLQGGKNRYHPTQKSLSLFEELIKKHSNEGDTVLDTFLGGGTTAVACKNTNRIFKGCEIEEKYYSKLLEILKI